MRLTENKKDVFTIILEMFFGCIGGILCIFLSEGYIGLGFLILNFACLSTICLSAKYLIWNV